MNDDYDVELGADIELAKGCILPFNWVPLARSRLRAYGVPFGVLEEHGLERKEFAHAVRVLFRLNVPEGFIRYEPNEQFAIFVFPMDVLTIPGAEADIQAWITMVQSLRINVSLFAS